jgi:hypothetical protein
MESSAATHVFPRRLHTRFVPQSGERTSTLVPLSHLALPTAEQKPKLLDQVRDAIRTRHYSLQTEKAYVQWTKRFIHTKSGVERPIISLSRSIRKAAWLY